jgi:hypothetical protein
LLEELQVQSVPLFVDGDIAIVLNPLKEAISFEGSVLYLLEKQAAGAIGDQFAIELLSQYIFEV